MRKNITREQVVSTALELMQNKNDLRGLNMREIARALGCAHTNIYNYFPSYNDLLWETHAALQEAFMGMLAEKLKTADSAELRLSFFFKAFVDTYLDKKGWFRLAWHEYIGGERPLRDIEATEKTNAELNRHIAGIWKGLTGEDPDEEQARRVLHNTHCYIVGEISNYLLGRGLFENEAELKAYITAEAIRMFRLCLAGGDAD
ncbi:MAG: TetR/AcrR family transcriptional regulator [Clostridiales bacterium]|nr:TetR/AcrR family transcriptional regulator [Clostridiales bacterium]